MSLTQIKTSNIDNSGSGLNFRNRIINGDMRIDQRNAGASITPIGGTYTLDRFRYFASQADKVSLQQVTDAPSGFSYSAKITVLSSYNLSGNEQFFFGTTFEANNLDDFGFGTSNAKATVLSFWVKSSVIGKYSISWVDTPNAYSFIGTYVINSANTWEYKTITIPPATGGTWGAGNSRHSFIQFMLGNSGSYDGTAGTWQSANVRGTNDSIDFVSQSNGSTFQVTGVQLEAGSVATPFEHRQYGTELALCQRYCYQIDASTNTVGGIAVGRYGSSTQTDVDLRIPLMRNSPTVTVSSASHFTVNTPAIANAATGATVQSVSNQNIRIAFDHSSDTFHARGIRFNNSSGYIRASAEL